jgi:hypothetical protein
MIVSTILVRRGTDGVDEALMQDSKMSPEW